MLKFYKIQDILDNDIIIRSSCGVYILSKNRKFPYYVGRSDINLRERILTSSLERDCDYFSYKETTSPRNAFLLEYRYYHGLTERGYKLANEIHPDVPDGTYWRCPVEGCEWR